MHPSVLPLEHTLDMNTRLLLNRLHGVSAIPFPRAAIDDGELVAPNRYDHRRDARARRAVTLLA